MSSPDFNNPAPYHRDPELSWEIFPNEVVWEPSPEIPPPPVHRRRVLLPLLLFIATCLSTLYVGYLSAESGAWGNRVLEGLAYAVPLMTILICHEAGHFFQARRYGVFCSFPHFIPIPIPPLGTFGAVIAMEPRMGDRRALFDIGITGPLAGLVPTLIFCVWGLYLSHPHAPSQVSGDVTFVSVPLLFQVLMDQIHGPIPVGSGFLFHPMAFAGWVGLLITSLNLMPVGQLDGGHVLYGLLRKRAHTVATLVLLGAIAAVIWFNLIGWTLMLMLLVLMGPVHPPTANDDVPLGPVRVALGWLTLAFIPIGFTPNPFPFGL